MSVGFNKVRLSKIDEERFGILIAKAEDFTYSNLPTILDFCHSKKVAMLIARCQTRDLKTAQAMEKEGFLLMDTLVYYTRNLLRKPPPKDITNIPIRAIQPGEEHVVKKIAEKAFQGYFGHYHADEKLDRAKCDEIYSDWAYRSCVSKDVADEVLVANQGGTVLGFATLCINTPDEGEGVLFGVIPEAQGRGIYNSFMIKGMEWCLSNNARRMNVSTQIQNIAVQKVWSRLGFEPNHSYFTFHKWFDE
jgi:RimJ/RimL family protein N-acetyltransferase